MKNGSLIYTDRDHLKSRLSSIAAHHPDPTYFNAGTYQGPNRRLQGKRAMLHPHAHDPDFVLAQFDDRGLDAPTFKHVARTIGFDNPAYLKNCVAHGWKPYPRRYFRQD